MSDRQTGAIAMVIAFLTTVLFVAKIAGVSISVFWCLSPIWITLLFGGIVLYILCWFHAPGVAFYVTLFIIIIAFGVDNGVFR